MPSGPNRIVSCKPVKCDSQELATEKSKITPRKALCSGGLSFILQQQNPALLDPCVTVAAGWFWWGEVWARMLPLSRGSPVGATPRMAVEQRQHYQLEHSLTPTSHELPFRLESFPVLIAAISNLTSSWETESQALSAQDLPTSAFLPPTPRSLWVSTRSLPTAVLDVK